MKKETKKETPLVNAEQLSLILNVSEFTIKKLARSKEIPCSYINGKIAFSMESVLARFKELEGGAA
jgi:hypothetical protein